MHQIYIRTLHTHSDTHEMKKKIIKIKKLLQLHTKSIRTKEINNKIK